MDHETAPTRRDEIGRLLRARGEVATVMFESRTDAHRGFRELFANEGLILQSTPASALPESFRVWLREPGRYASFEAAVVSVQGVQTVRDERPALSGKARLNVEGPLSVIEERGYYLNTAGARIRRPPRC